ncbi:HNH endonuclease [Sphingobium sp. JS3065]|uniref:HNH endonuclease n=1 Tax=Sphingobium sp. JS3065 TaxID=2970925 RepID=UPI002263B3BE|nr:HNH endonuclease [Sphingobium sp. JS3065]UZW54046.1 HNH endonuclease [Sphingobium sp. JS3065]
MGKLKFVGSRLSPLKQTLGYLAPDPSRKEANRKTFSPWRRLYSTARWRQLRMKIFVRDNFTCQWPGCGKVQGNTSLLVADHRTPHRGDEVRFWDERNLWTLCKACHDGPKQKAERDGLI